MHKLCEALIKKSYTNIKNMIRYMIMKNDKFKDIIMLTVN